MIAADKRFYTTVTLEYDNEKDDSDEHVDKKSKESTTTTQIHVDSPQFHTKWDYEYDTIKETLNPSPENQSVNPFVEKTLRVCLLYICPTKYPTTIKIKIQADNDFYSVLPHLPTNKGTGEIERTPAAVEALPKFLNCPVDDLDGKTIVNKTGLGSSAALTTSLVGSLVYAFNKQNDISPPANINEIIHNLAQICHCYAQGKVGSGFDVSSACHGTHIYRRFPKCLLPDLLSELEKTENDTSHPDDNTQGNTHTCSGINPMEG